MSFQNKIEQCLKEIQGLEKSFREAQGKEILPLSFFSSSIDILNNLRTEIYEIEAKQSLMMQIHSKEKESVLADTIGRKINTDFGKSLSINDRFMFQRDLFQGNTDAMNQALAQLNTFQSLNEALDFLNEIHVIPWKSDSGVAFKELLVKRFA